MAVRDSNTAYNVLTLHYQNKDGQVRVIPPDRDELVMSVETAVKACGAYTNQIRFNDQFEMLLQYLGDWIQQHSNVIRDACLTVRDSGLLFVVVTREPEYNEKFEDELSELDIAIANDNDYNLIVLNVLALPDVSETTLSGFLCDRMKIKYVVSEDAQSD